MVERTLILLFAAAVVFEGTAKAQVLTTTTANASATSTTVEDLASGDDWSEFDDLDSPAALQSPTQNATDGSSLLSSVGLHGFVEGAAGGRVVRDGQSADELLLGESRGRLQVDLESDLVKAQLTLDFIGDAVSEDLEIDLRNAWVNLAIGRALTVRAGRQILTWGTGDFLFLNDLFPKDFQSFFIGRADEFLKAPSTSLRATLTFGTFGLDAVWTPIFEADRFITGERLSFFFFPEGQVIGPRSEQTPIRADVPSKTFKNGEYAARLYGQIAGWELAAYGYWGFFKQPLRFDPNAMTLSHPRLAVYGGSVRGALFGSIVNLEGAYYHSIDDEEGDDPFVPNSQLRLLAGFSSEVMPRFTVGLQGYLEYLLSHDTLLNNSPFPELEPEEVRVVLTVRLTFLALSDNLRLGFFGFFSPTEIDTYLRPTLTYRFTDAFEATAGGNVFFGDMDQTFFGQLEDNTNVYVRLRYSY